MYDKSGPDARAVYSARATTVTQASNKRSVRVKLLSSIRQSPAIQYDP